MKICLALSWIKGSVNVKSFKEEACFYLVREYTNRLSKFCPVEVKGFDLEREEKSQAKLWFCHTTKASKTLSSEELSKEIQRLQNSGVRELRLAIGPSDGFTKKDLEKFSPDLLWSFGPMTLPHELAAVVAAEQLYRAFTILKNHPYHAGH